MAGTAPVNFNVRLTLPSSPGWCRFEGREDCPNDLVNFDIPLCGRRIVLGSTGIPQFWMDKRRLMPTRKRSGQIFGLILGYWWARAWAEGAAENPDMIDIYLLASLLPETRAHGSGHIVADASIAARQKVGDVEMLEEMLRASRNERFTVVQFRDQTADTIGPVHFERDVRDLYDTMVKELLSKGREAIKSQGAAGLDVFKEHWAGWMKRIGRYGRDPQRTKILDILSFESRAAFYTCYDIVWRALLPKIDDVETLAPETARFHALWHFVLRLPGNEAGYGDFFLFQGIPFALHPAASLLIQTSTGQSLIEDFICNPVSHPEQRLYHAMSVAVHHYKILLDEAKDKRRGSGLNKILKRRSPRREKHARRLPED